MCVCIHTHTPSKCVLCVCIQDKSCEPSFQFFKGPAEYIVCDMRVPFLPLLTIPSHQEWPIMSRITGINQDLSLSLCYCYCCTTANTNISRPQRYLSIHPSPFGIRHSCLGWLKFKPLYTFFYWCTHQLNPPPPPPILILRHTHVVDLVRFYRRQQHQRHLIIFDTFPFSGQRAAPPPFKKW